MYQAVFLDTYIDESAEVGDIPHDARQFHAYAQIIDCTHVLIELEHLDRSARVTPRLLQLLQDILQGRHSDGGREVAFRLYLPAQFFVGNQFGHAASQVLCHLLHDVVAFGMHRRVVQRIPGIRYAQEAGTLLKSLCAHARNFHQLLARCECSVLGAVVHDVLRQLRTKSRYIRQQMAACRIQVYADQVYAVLHGLVEGFLQLGLVYVVLVLPHTDGLRVYLDKLRQRVHKPAGDGYGTAHRYIIFRKLIPGYLGSGVDGCTLLADNENLHFPVERLPFQEIFRLAAGSAVAHGDGFHLIGLYHLLQFGKRLFALVHRRMWVDILVVQQVALRIQAHHLTAGAESGVYSHHPFLPQGRCQQQLPQVFRKDADGFIVGTLLALRGKLGLDGRFQQTLVGILHGFRYLLPAGVVTLYKLPFQPFHTLFVVGADTHFEQTFRFGAADGKQAVRAASLQGLRTVEVIPVFGAFLLFAFYHFGGQQGLACKGIPQHAAGAFVLAHLFGYDVACAFQGIVRILYIAFYEGGGTLFGMRLALEHQQGGKRFESFLAGGFRTGFPFGLVGQVDVFEGGAVPRVVNALLQFRGHFPLFADGGDDGLLPFRRFLQFFVMGTDGFYLHFVQSARHFLAVAADERDGCSVVEQGECLPDLLFRYAENGSYHAVKDLCHVSFFF